MQLCGVEVTEMYVAGVAEVGLGHMRSLSWVVVAELVVAHLSEKSSRRQYKKFSVVMWSTSEMESYIHGISPGYWLAIQILMKIHSWTFQYRNKLDSCK